MWTNMRGAISIGELPLAASRNVSYAFKEEHAL